MVRKKITITNVNAVCVDAESRQFAELSTVVPKKLTVDSKLKKIAQNLANDWGYTLISYEAKVESVVYEMSNEEFISLAKKVED